jgi:hypothetical protein
LSIIIVSRRVKNLLFAPDRASVIFRTEWIVNYLTDLDGLLRKFFDNRLN